MDEMMHTEENGNGVYELGFILVPSITEEKLAETFGAIKGLIEAKGAVAISEEFPKIMTLAYTMEKVISNKIERFHDGYFGWIKFELDPSIVAPVDAMMRLREDVIRHLITTTVRENTIASKRPFSGPRRRKDDVKEKDPNAPEMSKEEIDREIEALVTPTAEVKEEEAAA
jgi:ribosomal protein S6